MRCAHAHLKMFSKETCFFILSDIVYVTLLHKFLRENEPASFLIKQLIRTNKFIGFHFFFLSMRDSNSRPLQTLGALNCQLVVIFNGT